MSTNEALSEILRATYEGPVLDWIANRNALYEAFGMATGVFDVPPSVDPDLIMDEGL